jgi:hypothetical protein
MSSNPRISCQDGALAKGYDMENKPALRIVQLITTRNVAVRSDYQKLDYKEGRVEKGGC